MKKLGIVLLGLSAALPLHAQDPGAETPPDASAAPAEATPAEAPPADSPPAETSATPPAEATAETPPAETPPAESPPADATVTAEAPPAEAAPAEAVPAEATFAEAPPAETPTDITAVETPPAEETPAEPAEEENPLIFYVGADYGMAKVSISNVPGFATTDTTTVIYQARVGMRIHEAIGLEVHYGRGNEDDNTPWQAMLETYYGVYIVPTGTLLDAVEFAFPLGFAWTRLKDADSTAALNGVSYGMNIEFPFKLVFEAMPDIRIGGGGMVYQQNNAARTYGWHAGLRFDFGIGGSAPAPQPVAEVAPAPPPEPPQAPEPPPPCQAPAPGQPANLEGCKVGETLVLQGVNFEFDKAALTVNAKTLLDQVADELNKRPDIKFAIDGHTDGKGSEEYNQKLSERRAASVKDYLASKNVDGSRMTANGFGESMPIADNNTDEGREQNRRVELKVTEIGSAAADTSAPAPSETTSPAPDTSTPATPSQ